MTQEHSSPPSRHSHRPPTAHGSRPPPQTQPARDVCNFAYSEDFHGNDQTPHDVTLHIDSSPPPHEKKSLLLCLDIDVASPDRPDHSIPVTVVLDTASDVSYISEDLATDLQLPTSNERMRSLTVFDSENAQSRLTADHPLLISLRNGQREKIVLHSTRIVCPPLNWAEKKEGVIVPRRSRPRILLGMNHLRSYFITPSLRIDSFPDHILLHTLLGPVVSIEKESTSNTLASLTGSRLPPDKAPAIDESGQHHCRSAPISDHAIEPLQPSSHSLCAPSIGDVVLVENESADPLHWTLGRLIRSDNASPSSALVCLITGQFVTRPLTTIHRVNIPPDKFTSTTDLSSFDDTRKPPDRSSPMADSTSCLSSAPTLLLNKALTTPDDSPASLHEGTSPSLYTISLTRTGGHSPDTHPLPLFIDPPERPVPTSLQSVKIEPDSSTSPTRAALPPVKTLLIGDDPTHPILSGSSTPDRENFSLETSSHGPSLLFPLQGDDTHTPLTSTSQFSSLTPSLDRPAHTAPTTVMKDRDNPGSDTRPLLFCPLSPTAGG